MTSKAYEEMHDQIEERDSAVKVGSVTSDILAAVDLVIASISPDQYSDNEFIARTSRDNVRRYKRIRWALANGQICIIKDPKLEI